MPTVQPLQNACKCQFYRGKLIGGRGLEPRTNGLRGTCLHTLRNLSHRARNALDAPERDEDAKIMPTISQGKGTPLRACNRLAGV